MTNIALCLSFTNSYGMLNAMKDKIFGSSYSPIEGNKACQEFDSMRKEIASIETTNPHLKNEQKNLLRVMQFGLYVCNKREKVIALHQANNDPKTKKSLIMGDDSLIKGCHATKLDFSAFKIMNEMTKPDDSEAV